jgi:branched-chain amino acid transport system substrate-binding protein
VPQLDRRQLLRVVGALAATGVAGQVAGCNTPNSGAGPTRPRGERVPIGFIAPATGPLLAVGADMTQGFKLYLDLNNTMLGQRPVDLIEVDEGATPATAKTAVDSLIERNVLAMVGLANPAGLLAVRDDVENARIPLLASNAAPTTLTGALYIWRAGYVDGEAGAAIGRYTAGLFNRAYILTDASASSQDEVDEFRTAFTDAGGKVVGQRILTSGFGQAMSQVRLSGAQMLFGSYGSDDGGQFLAAYATSGLTVPLFAPGRLTEGATRPRQLDKNFRMPNTIYTALNYAPDLDNEANRRFVSAYHDAYGSQPTAYAMTAYDCAFVLDLALQQLGPSPVPADVNQAMSVLGQIESPRGTWAFNSNRGPQQRWYLRRLQLDGQVLANLVDADLEVLS